MPRGRGAQPRPVARGPTETPKKSRRRQSRYEDEDDMPGPADAFYEAEDIVAPEDAGGASARRFDVSFVVYFFVLSLSFCRWHIGSNVVSVSRGKHAKKKQEGERRQATRNRMPRDMHSRRHRRRLAQKPETRKGGTAPVFPGSFFLPCLHFSNDSSPTTHTHSAPTTTTTSSRRTLRTRRSTRTRPLTAPTRSGTDTTSAGGREGATTKNTTKTKTKRKKTLRAASTTKKRKRKTAPPLLVAGAGQRHQQQQQRQQLTPSTAATTMTRKKR